MPAPRKRTSNRTLFIAKTSIESQRSSGYSGTHSAVNEFVDNSIEAGATEVRVYTPRNVRGGSLRAMTSSYLTTGEAWIPIALASARFGAATASIGKASDASAMVCPTPLSRRDCT